MTCTIVTNGEELLLKCKNEGEEPYRSIKMPMRYRIWELYCKGYDTFYLNCEYGVPMWAAQFICALKFYNNITLNIVVPHYFQFYNWTDEYRHIYFDLNCRADSSVTPNFRYHEKSYDYADEFMIDRSDLLLVFGKPEDKLHAVDYAKRMNVKIEYYPLDYSIKGSFSN